ncbi:MAG: alkaline phosphatase PhoX [Bacteroidota bacterium]
MKKLLLTLLVSSAFAVSAMAQGSTIFGETIELPEDFVPLQVIMPPSPLTMQVLFVGGSDRVQTTPTYGYEAGEVYAKEWHDFIGFTPDNDSDDLGWVSVNHEEIYRDNRIGDGGGMSVFKIKRAADGSLEVVDQTLSDGRTGKYFNVDFVNTVGETGMNCAGISSVWDGRIWTAEEWFRTSNASINNGATRSSNYPLDLASGDYLDSLETFFEDNFGLEFDLADANSGVRNTSDFTISSDIDGFDGLTVKKYQNFNWMVEIDPKEAKAIRKQYNWGRQGFEGGTIGMDQTAYLGEDGTPGWFTKFVPDEVVEGQPVDYTKGRTFVYKHDADPAAGLGNWVEIENNDPEKMLGFKDQAVAAGATMYNRIEWVAVDSTTGIVYWTETGRDNPGSRWRDEAADGAVHDPYTLARAAEFNTHPDSSDYPDYYGRIWAYNPETDLNYVIIEGGPFFTESPSVADYPEKHLSNADGLNVIYIPNDQGGVSPFLLIMEDLNGSSRGRMPAGISNRTCEVYLLDLAIENPTIDDLIRLTATPRGAEVTGGIQTSDLASVLLNSQHPNIANEFPWNHSLTFAINGFDQLTVTDLEEPTFEEAPGFQVYPNPTTREVFFKKAQDAAIYNNAGQRLRVFRNVTRIDVSEFPAGIYYIQNGAKQTQKLIIE